MNEYLRRIVDIIAVLFGEEIRSSEPPAPPPPGLPPAAPPTPTADPNEPQDASDITPGDAVVTNHELEPAPVDTPEFDTVPLPPPSDPIDSNDPTSGPTTNPSPTPPGPEYRARYLWCIDNGHGKRSPGKRSPVLPDGRQLFEYEFNRDITRRIFARLDEIGIAYFEVTPEVDVGNFLKERVQRANSVSSGLPKLFVSIHGNAGPAPNPQSFTQDHIRGIETWHYHGAGRSRQLARIFQRHLIDKTGLKNRHLKSKVTGQFYVLRATRMPAILTENGFYNNRFELPLMLTDSFRQQVAEAHVAAIIEVETFGLEAPVMAGPVFTTAGFPQGPPVV